jgi:hypothetical protein
MRGAWPAASMTLAGGVRQRGLGSAECGVRSAERLMLGGPVVDDEVVGVGASGARLAEVSGRRSPFTVFPAQVEIHERRPAGGVHDAGWWCAPAGACQCTTSMGRLWVRSPADRW